MSVQPVFSDTVYSVNIRDEVVMVTLAAPLFDEPFEMEDGPLKRTKPTSNQVVARVAMTRAAATELRDRLTRALTEEFDD